MSWKINTDTKLEIFNRLINKESFSIDSVIPRVEGRIDIGGIQYKQRFQFKYETITSVEFVNVDFSGADFCKLLFEGCIFKNCLFDGTTCKDWGLHGCEIVDSKFIQTDLSNSAFGLKEGMPTRFKSTEFIKTNLKSSSPGDSVFEDCLFDNCKLNKVHFRGTKIRKSKFKGKLNGTIFWRESYTDGLEGELENVDFSEADLRMVEFSELNLREVTFPANEDHIVVHDYRNTLKKLCEKFKGHDLFFLLDGSLSNAGAEQEIGVFHAKDIEKESGPEAVNEFRQALKEL